MEQGGLPRERATLIRSRIVLRLVFSALSFGVCLSFAGIYTVALSGMHETSGGALPGGAVAVFIAVISTMLALSALYLWLARRYLEADGSDERPAEPVGDSRNGPASGEPPDA